MPAERHPLRDDAWVRFEAVVLGDSLVTEIVDGDTVMRFGQLKANGKPLNKGRVYLQEEGQDTWIRIWQIRELNRNGTPIKPTAILNLASPGPRIFRTRPLQRDGRLVIPASYWQGRHGDFHLSLITASGTSLFSRRVRIRPANAMDLEIPIPATGGAWLRIQ